jgi:hypothetical protein
VHVNYQALPVLGMKRRAEIGSVQQNAMKKLSGTGAVEHGC